MSSISEQFEKSRSDLSPLSIKTYVNCLNKVLSLIDSNDTASFYNKSDEIIKKLNTYYNNPNTIKTKYGSILAYLSLLKSNKDIIQAQANYLTETDRLNHLIKNKLKDNQKDEKQIQNMATKDEREEIETDLKSKVVKNPKSFAEYVALRNYTLFKLYQSNPTRLDYADSKIIYSNEPHESDEYNYIILNKKNKKVQYIMNTYKTAKTYGQKIINIEDGLFSLLNDYKKVVDKFNSDNYFLLNDKGKQMSRNNLSVLFKSFGKVINKPITVSGNRHSAVSDLVPVQQMQELANKMGNSLNEQVGVYAKI